jgi:hypothetical protein
MPCPTTIPQRDRPETHAKVAEHYRKLTGGSRAGKGGSRVKRVRHYAKPADYWKLADAAQNTSSNSE